MDTTKNLMTLAALAIAAPAFAQGLTVVNEPWPGEASQSQMFSGIFGGSFTSMGQVSGLDTRTGGSGTVDIGFSNGSVSAVRVGDMGGGSSTNLFGLSAAMNDQLFAAGSYRASVIGHNSALSHEFGLIEDGSFRSLLSSSDDGDATIHPKGEFTWAIQTSNGGEFSSDDAMNGGTDHMVTYALFDAQQNLIGAVLFFEDWGGAGSDYDFNDLGVLLTLAPTPNAALLGLAGLGGIGLTSGRRRR